MEGKQCPGKVVKTSDEVGIGCITESPFILIIGLGDVMGEERDRDRRKG